MSTRRTRKGRERLVVRTTRACPLAALSLLAALSGCPTTETPDASPDSDVDLADAWRGGTFPVDTVDLLFVLEDRLSTPEERDALSVEVPRLLRLLGAGDRDDDGTPDFRPIRSLHVGVITPNLGAGPNDTVPTCQAGLGDDGILRSRSRTPTAPCRMTYPSGIFALDPGFDDDAAYAETLRCVMDVGTGGCAFRQPLEAALKAVTPMRATAWTRPGYTPPRFVGSDNVPDSVPGNGESPGNNGFLRSTSALAIVLVIRGEDCSVIDYNLFSSTDVRYADTHLNLRCNAFADRERGVLHPIDRYVTGLLGLRGDARHLFFSAIVGIPPETESSARAGDFAAVLAHPDMSPRVDPSGTRLEPSCSFEGREARPPVRIVQAAQALSAQGAAVSVTSICSGSFRSAIDDLVGNIADVADGVSP